MRAGRHAGSSHSVSRVWAVDSEGSAGALGLAGLGVSPARPGLTCSAVLGFSLLTCELKGNKPHCLISDDRTRASLVY